MSHSDDNCIGQLASGERLAFKENPLFLFGRPFYRQGQH